MTAIALTLAFLLAPPPGAYAARDYPSLQAAADAAFAYTASDPLAGAVLDVPPGRLGVAGPVYLDGQRLTVRGLGSGSRVECDPPYGGPPFVVGVVRLPAAEALRHRPPALALDGPARLAEDSVRTPRRALATKGSHSFACQPHAIQLGANRPGGNVPDYWGGPAYTFEFLVVKPPGAAWGPAGDWTGLWGLKYASEPAPVMFLRNETGFELWLKTSDQSYGDGKYHTLRLATPADPVPAPWGVSYALCVQLDLDACVYRAWLGGRPCAVAVPPALKPGMRLKAPDGARPWTFGAKYGWVPGGAKEVTDAELHGFRATRGTKYRPDAPTQARTDGAAVDDMSRYFRSEPNTVAYLPLDDAPATHAVVLDGLNRRGVGFWVPGDQPWTTNARIGLRDLAVASPAQAAVVVGPVMGLDLIGVDASGGLQGVGSLSYGCAYPINLRGCRLSGYSAAYYGYNQIVTARDAFFPQVGRHGVLMCGGSSYWQGLFMTWQTIDTESYCKYLASAYGQTHRLTDLIVDNEEAGASVAGVECERGYSNLPTRYVLDGIDVAIVPTGTSLVTVRTTPDARDGKPAVFNAVNLGNYGGGSVTPLRVDGPGWVGSFDASGLPSAGVAGDGAARVKVAAP